MTDAEIIENGRRLFQSAQNLRRSAPDLDALMGSLWEAVESQEYIGPIEDLGDEDASDNGWLSAGFAYNVAVFPQSKTLPVRPGRKKKPIQIGSLTFIVRLCNLGEVEGDAVHWPWLDQACLILGWHRSERADDYWEIENFELTDVNIASIAHAGSGLWAWQLDGEYYSYFFAIPIFALRNEQDLENYALRPLKALFYSEYPVAAAPEVLQDIPSMQPPNR